jgi:hypothetical protein
VNPLITSGAGAARARSYFVRVDSPGAGPDVVLAGERYIGRFEHIRARLCGVENL